MKGLKHRPKRFNCGICGRPISHRGNCMLCNVKRKRERERGHSYQKTYYTDSQGYKRTHKNHSNLEHRQIAYHEIYLKNRHKYPLKFSHYVVHHADGNKKNNRVKNLVLMTPEDHRKVHGIDNRYWQGTRTFRYSSKGDTFFRLYGKICVAFLIVTIVIMFILGLDTSRAEIFMTYASVILGVMIIFGFVAWLLFKVYRGVRSFFKDVKQDIDELRR